MTDATTPEQPRTAAGRALLATFERNGQRHTAYEVMRDAILAIEAQARPAVASELRAALVLLDSIICHVESWPPAGDSFLDDLRTIRALADAGSVPADAGSVPDMSTDEAWRNVRAAMTPIPPSSGTGSVGALDVERLAQYAGALEAIVRSLPGGPIVNGVAMSPEEALADLRRRFDVDGKVIDQATLKAGITHDEPIAYDAERQGEVIGLRDCPDRECKAEQGCGDCLRTCREHDHSAYRKAQRDAERQGESE